MSSDIQQWQTTYGSETVLGTTRAHKNRSVENENIASPEREVFPPKRKIAFIPVSFKSKKREFIRVGRGQCDPDIIFISIWGSCPSTDCTNPPHYSIRPIVDTSATRSNGEDRLKVEPFGLRPVNSHSVVPLGFNNRGARATKRRGTIAYAVDMNGWIE
ncbi:hypothetical protein NPIL_204011 [Nephila pilipes]|uniref:Uncharacterized protein n=1 Tax=Nephila pilipes TaxID=299642 RepID=A0A8X6P617_NEPPI|nr:hypothetical protein NPIL_204011 [Nephila pilipes]